MDLLALVVDFIVPFNGFGMTVSNICLPSACWQLHILPLVTVAPFFCIFRTFYHSHHFNLQIYSHHHQIYCPLWIHSLLFSSIKSRLISFHHHHRYHHHRYHPQNSSNIITTGYVHHPGMIYLLPCFHVLFHHPIPFSAATRTSAVVASITSEFIIFIITSTSITTSASTSIAYSSTKISTTATDTAMIQKLPSLLP